MSRAGIFWGVLGKKSWGKVCKQLAPFTKVQNKRQWYKPCTFALKLVFLGQSFSSMLFSLYRYFQKNWRTSGPLGVLLRLLALLFLLFVCYTVLFKYAENTDWEEAIWQAWQTMTTVGYGNRPAETSLGRWATMVVTTVGIAVLGAAFSAAFDVQAYLSSQKRLGYMENPYKNAYIIFNFPGENALLKFIQEIRTVEPLSPVCLVDANLEQLPESIRRLDKIHFVRGNALSRRTYEEARIINAKAVIIFPINASVPDSDGATRTIVDLVSEHTSEAVRLIHVLVDQDNAWMFEHTRSTEVLESFEVLAIVQECQDPHSVGVIEKLLFNSKGANPRTVAPTLLKGWTWGRFVEGCLRLNAQENLRCNPLALIREGDNDSCPPAAEELHEGDLLSVIADKDLDWENFQQKLLALKLF